MVADEASKVAIKQISLQLMKESETIHCQKNPPIQEATFPVDRDMMEAEENVEDDNPDGFLAALEKEVPKGMQKFRLSC